jgi:hypothetical protein
MSQIINRSTEYNSAKKNFLIHFKLNKNSEEYKMSQEETNQRSRDHKGEIEIRINRLKLLKEDWDGYGALPVFDRCIKNALNVLWNEQLSSKYITEVYPNNNGTVSIEWEHDDNLISAEFGIDSFAYYVDLNGHTYFEKEQSISSENIKRLADYARKL